jgi:exopolysaccharide production protein ExoQ
VTTPATAWRGPASAAQARHTVMDVVAFALSVFMVLVYSEAWLIPLFGDNIDVAASGTVRAMFFPAYAAGLLLLAMRPGEPFRGLLRQPFLILLVVIAAASVTWSVAPDQTVRRVVALAFTIIGGVVLGARWRWATLTEVLATAFAILAVGSAIAGALIPSIGRMTELFPGAWRGLWSEKNTLGGMMAFAFLIFMAAGFYRRQRLILWWGMAALALALLVLSTSKTSLVALTLGVAALGFVLLARRGGSIAVIATYGAVVGMLALSAGILFAPDVFLGLLGKDATLTGRTKIWDAIIRLIREQPWLGYGYGAVWNDPSGRGPLAWIIKQAGYRPEHAHNSWLEQWLGMGLIGLAAWALCYLSTLFRTIWAVFTSRGGLLAFPFMVVYTLITLTESVAVAYNDVRWLMFVAIAIRLALPERAPASNHVRIERRPIQPHGQGAYAQRRGPGQGDGFQHWTP